MAGGELQIYEIKTTDASFADADWVARDRDTDKVSVKAQISDLAQYIRQRLTELQADQLLINTTSTSQSFEGSSQSPYIINTKDGSSTSNASFSGHDASLGVFGVLDLIKSRGTGASPANVADGDILGALRFRGYNSSYWGAAYMDSQVDGTPTSTYMPGKLQFNVTDNSGSFQDMMAITYSGVGIGDAKVAADVDDLLHIKDAITAGSGVRSRVENTAATGDKNVGDIYKNDVNELFQGLSDVGGGHWTVFSNTSGNNLVTYDITNKGFSVGPDGSSVPTITVNGSTQTAKFFSEYANGSVNALLGINHGNGNPVQVAGGVSAGTIASPTIAVDNQTSLQLAGYGYDGTDYETMASIQYQVNGTPAAGDMPGKILFKTTQSGQVIPNLALSIFSDQSSRFEGNVFIGDTDHTSDHSLMMQSQGRTYIALKADTNNSGEANHAATFYIQDGGAIPTAIGTGLGFSSGAESNNLNHIVTDSHHQFFTNGTITGTTGDTVPEVSSAGTLVLQINNTSSDVRSRDHLPLANNTYDIGSSSLKWAQGWFVNATIDDLTVNNTLLVDTINEETAGAGVTIDSVLLKDADIQADQVRSGLMSAIASDLTLESTNTNGSVILSPDGTGNVRIGGTTVANDRQLLIQSQVDSMIHLDADTNNDSLAHNTKLLFTQNNQTHKSLLRQNPGTDNAFHFLQDSASAGFSFFVNSTIDSDGEVSNLGTVTLSVRSSDNTVVSRTHLPNADSTYDLGSTNLRWSSIWGDTVRTDTINEVTTDNGITVDSVLVKDGGLELATTGGTAARLDHYEETTHVFTLTSDIWGGDTVNLEVNITRIGREVTLSWATISQAMTNGTSNDYIRSTAGTVMPTRFRPNHGINHVMNGQDNSSESIIVATLLQSGDLRFGVSPGSTTNFTFNSSNSAQIYSNSMSYDVP